MIEWMFWTAWFLFWGVFLFRIVLSRRYCRQQREKEYRVDEKEYTVLQPILSGDGSLKNCLLGNLQQTTEMNFIWLLDRSDAEGIRIAEELLEQTGDQKRVQLIFFGPSPAQSNPKVFKLKAGLASVKTKYTMVVDDDTIISFSHFFKEAGKYAARQDEWLATGLPYHVCQGNMWTSLVAAFVNSQSLLSYLPLALLKQSNTINGMFYWCETELLRKTNAFSVIEEYVCDDYELARYLKKRQIGRIQATVPCGVHTSVQNGKMYVQLMKRWLVFANHYFKKEMTGLTFVCTIAPVLLQSFLLVMSLFSGFAYFAVFTISVLLQTVFLLVYRKEATGVPTALKEIWYEGTIGFLIMAVYVYALLFPKRIVWRNKKMRMVDGRIEVED